MKQKPELVDAKQVTETEDCTGEGGDGGGRGCEVWEGEGAEVEVEEEGRGRGRRGAEKEAGLHK